MWNIDKALSSISSAHDLAAMKTLEVIGEAADQQVPLDEGTLKASKFIAVIDGVGVISYGGGPGTGHAQVPYAIRHHEVPANFQRGRKSQYLRDPFNRLAKPTYEKFVEGTV